MSNQGAPTPNDPDLADPDLCLTHAIDIVGLLRRIVRKRCHVTAFVDDGHESFITVLTDVDEKRQCFSLDLAADADVNERALRAGRLICMTEENNVSVKFAANDLRKSQQGSDSVFLAPLPQQVFRLQRREYFRVSTPVSKPVICRITVDGDDVDLRITDLSVGGVGAVADNLPFTPEQGMVFESCTLRIPGDAWVQATLEVRSVHSHRLRDQSEQTRVGFAFRTLARQDEVFLQRYLHHLQLEQRKAGSA